MKKMSNMKQLNKKGKKEKAVLNFLSLDKPSII